MVGVYKRILLKVRETGQDSYLTMMAYDAPVSSNLRSPAELLNVWQIQSPLISKQQLSDEHTRMAKQEQKKSIDYYNKYNSWQHSRLQAEQKVYVQQEKTRLWEPRIIRHSDTSPRSYKVIHKRYRQFFRPAKRDSILKDRYNQPLVTDTNTSQNELHTNVSVPSFRLLFRAGHRQTSARKRYRPLLSMLVASESVNK